MAVSLTCATCGATLTAQDRFCAKCGTARSAAPTGAAPSIELPAPDLVLEKLRRATLGSYEIRGELGRGGMAVVYLARDLRLDRSVAIKVMLPGLFLTQGMAERFLQEARIAARLYHPNIIIVHAVEQTDDLFYFVMNLVEGAAVDELLRLRAPLAIDEVRWILLQAARALGHAHGEGVVHRDVKPANLMINTKGDLVVSDFGIAKVGESSHLTRTGAAIGTPAYMSPEQVMGMEVGAPSDQYSLGVAAFEMLTGRPPFGGAVLQIQWAHANDAPPSLRELRPDCPPALADAIGRMLAKKPEERWASFDALLPVFGEGLPADGGPARRALLDAANAIRAQRVSAQPELVARTPLSPIPTDIRSAPARDRAAHAAMVRCSPQTVTLSAGEMVTVRATVTDARGMPLSQVPLSWRSSDERVAGVSPRGDVLARSAGRVTITASVGEVSGEATVVVDDAPVVRVTIVVPSPVVRVHERMKLTARALDARGEAKSGATIEWSSSAPEIASVAADGTVSAVRTGQVVIRARVGTVEGSAALEVQSPAVAMVRILPEAPSVEVGDQTALVAEGLDAAGAVLDARPAFWEIADARIATIDQAGVVAGMTPGRVRVRATIDGVRAEKTLAVRAVPLASIALRLDTDRLHVGESAGVRIVGRDVHGREVPSVPLTHATFTSTDTATCTVDALGTLQGVAPGATEIGVTLPPAPGTDPVGSTLLEASLRVVVSPARVTAIVLTPDALALETEAVSRVTATVQGVGTLPLGDRAVSWSSLDPSIATVRDGAITAVAPGSTRIRATCDAVSVELPVTVSAPAVHELRLEASTFTVFVGDTVTLSAVALDRHGQRVRDAAVTWRTNAPSILSVDAGGVARGLAPGEATVVASCGAIRATGRVAVDEVPVTALRVAPVQGTLMVGRTLPLEVFATDARGREVGTLVMWTATPPAIASVGADGVVLGRAPGTVVITASRGDLRALAELTITAPVAQSIRLAPMVRAVRVGERATVQATVLADDGEAIAVPVEWTTDNVAVARVSSRGEIEGVGAGQARIQAKAGAARAVLALEVTAAAAAPVPGSVGAVQSSSRRSPVALI
ncbi:MAG: Ig-like domain-containing protein, partial [Gemmatimonadaceae bacterium]|nr:Ig-like domain-containing protein [Gemmatimonadaceae bacterium]